MALTLGGRRVSFAWLKPPPSTPDGTMSLWDHLRELRYRLTLSVIAVVVTAILSVIFYDRLYGLITYPYRGAVERLAVDNPGLETELVNTGVASPFLLAIKICALAGLVFSAPFWLYQLWRFISPALLSNEKRYSLAFIGSATPLFFGGITLAWFLLPNAIAIMLSFTPADQLVTNLIDVPTYLDFVMQLMLVFGAAMLLPVVVVALNIMGIVRGHQLKGARPFVIFGSFLLAAVATPTPDPISMLTLAIPVTVLFLIAELIARLNDKRRGYVPPPSADDAAPSDAPEINA